MDSMFWGSRAPWGRSEADGAKPPVKPGLKMPVLGVLILPAAPPLVKPPSSGLRIWTARRSLGRFCPAFRLPLAAAPVLNFWHWRPRWRAGEKGLSERRSLSSNRSCAWVCLWSAEVGPRQLWVMPTRAAAARSGSPAHSRSGSERQSSRPVAPRSAPRLFAAKCQQVFEWYAEPFGARQE